MLVEVGGIAVGVSVGVALGEGVGLAVGCADGVALAVGVPVGVGLGDADGFNPTAAVEGGFGVSETSGGTAVPLTAGGELLTGDPPPLGSGFAPGFCGGCGLAAGRPAGAALCAGGGALSPDEPEGCVLAGVGASKTWIFSAARVPPDPV